MIEVNNTRQAWDCKIGCVAGVEVPPGGDAPMRRAVQDAFRKLTGVDAEFTFSGWGAKLTGSELAVIENRAPRTPDPAPPEAYAHLRAAFTAGCRIQAWHLNDGAANSNDGRWDTLTPPEGREPEFGCAPHLYRVHPDDAERADDLQRSWAQTLIEKLPDGHEGRNSWLINYGIGPEADWLRTEHERNAAAHREDGADA